MKIGVLSIQGDFIEHKKALSKLGIEAVGVTLPEDLKGVTGLILPGGESTTIMKLMKRFGLDKEIVKQYKKNKLCIFGTCAGAVLLAKKIINNSQRTLALADIEIERNAYGRQIDSFEKEDMIFIRAPIIRNVGKNVEVIKEVDNNPVMIEQDNILITTFHPELTESSVVHKYFVDMCKLISSSCSCP